MSATEVQDKPATGSAWAGQSVPRKEDGRQLRGEGAFVDDAAMRHMGYVYFLRSPHAHARIVSIDVSRAAAMDGVYATLTGEEAEELTDPFFHMAPAPAHELREYCLAVGKARFMGDPVAAVMAESRELARDAAEAIEVVYEPLPAIVETVAAAEPDAPLVHENIGTNVVWHGDFQYGDIDWAIANADHVVRIPHMYFHRFSSTPLECNAALVNWDAGTGVIDIMSNIQMPMLAGMAMAPALRTRPDRINWESKDIGGGFGIKITSYTYFTAAALLSRKAGRPAMWTETRSEHLIGSGHGNERTFLDVEVPVQRDGTILGFRFRAFDDAGAYLHYEPLGAIIWAQALVGCYRFKHIGVDYSSVVTNKLPVCPNRGYSRMQHQWLVERIVDIVAQELDFDPIELRKHNFIKPDEYPYELPNGCVYDSGDLPLTLDKALALIDYPAWRARQQAAPDGVRIGIGIGSALDSGTSNFDQSRIINPMMNLSGNAEAAIVKLGVFGEVSIALGSVPQGQSHETTAAQVAADVLGVGVDDIDVTVGFRSLQNTATVVSGTYASQFAVTGLCAVLGAADMLKTEICRIAAFALEADPGDIELVGGMARVAGDPDREIPFAGVANMVHANMLALPKELADSVSLVCRYVYRPDLERIDPERKYGRLAYTYASQIHACVVEVDEATGQVKVVDYGAVDDCGVRINPQVIEGQVHGAAAHGVGGALFETFAYDADGQLPNATFFDYHIPTAADLPDIKTDDVVSPSPMSPNGAKGMGEGGGAALYAVGAAIQDALRGTGAAITQSHIPPDLVHALLHGEQTERSRVEVESR